jgi:hypothetical protein
VNMVMNLCVPQNVGNFLSGLATVDFLRRTWLRGISGRNLTEILYWHLSEGTEETKKNLQTGWPMSRPRFEPSAS